MDLMWEEDPPRAAKKPSRKAAPKTKKPSTASQSLEESTTPVIAAVKSTSRPPLKSHSERTTILVQETPVHPSASSNPPPSHSISGKRIRHPPSEYWASNGPNILATVNASGNTSSTSGPQAKKSKTRCSNTETCAVVDSVKPKGSRKGPRKLPASKEDSTQIPSTTENLPFHQEIEIKEAFEQEIGKGPSGESSTCQIRLSPKSGSKPKIGAEELSETMTEAFIHSTELKKAQKVIADLQMRFEEYKNMRTTDAEKRLEEYKKISSAKYNALSNELDSHRDKYIFSSSELQKTLLVCKNQAVELQNSQKEISKLRERLNTLESNQKVFSGDVQVATTNSFTEKLEGNALEDLRKAQDESKHLAQKLKSSTKSYDKLNSEYIRWKENSEAESKKLKEALDAKSKALEKSESIVKDLKAEVVTLQSKLTSIQNRARSEVSERPAMPDRYVQMIESMLRMYEELTHIHIQSVEETRCEIDSDDEEDERSGDVDEIDHARRKSVRRQTIGVFQKGCGIEDALRYTFEQKGKIGGFITCWMIQADRMTDIKFSLTVSKEQTADSSKNVLYSLHSAKDVRGVEFEEDSDELPEYLNGEMTFPRERLADFFRKTSGWLFSA